MRLLLSTTNHMNTNLSDEQGFVHYAISTSLSNLGKKVTTVTKYRRSGSSGVPETMGVIEWRRFTPTVLRFDGKVVSADVMLEMRPRQTGRYFMGPDHKMYKWKMAPRYCWLKDVESGAMLVRFHLRNLGILKPFHPAYLDVYSTAVLMLDQVVLTFVCIESLRIEREWQQYNMANSMQGANNVNMVVYNLNLMTVNNMYTSVGPSRDGWNTIRYT